MVEGVATFRSVILIRSMSYSWYSPMCDQDQDGMATLIIGSVPTWCFACNFACAPLISRTVVSSKSHHSFSSLYPEERYRRWYCTCSTLPMTTCMPIVLVALAGFFTEADVLHLGFFTAGFFIVFFCAIL